MVPVVILAIVSLTALFTSYFISHIRSVSNSHSVGTYTTKLNMEGDTEYKAVVYFVNWWVLTM